MASITASLIMTSPRAQVLRFSGYDWIVKEGRNLGPGPNHWDKNNVFVDSQGYLHLKLSQKAGEWFSAEVTSVQRFGFGRYEFVVDGNIDRLDHNVVLGMFNYPPPDVGPNGTNEIDIEFARFGNPNSRSGNYSIAPSINGFDVITRSFPIVLETALSSHSFTWHPKSILFSSRQGDRLAESQCDDADTIVMALYQPRNAHKQIPQYAMPVHLNLWSFKGLAPTNGQEVEIVIRSFRYRPLNAPDDDNPFGQITNLCTLKMLTESRLSHAQYFSVYAPPR